MSSEEKILTELTMSGQSNKGYQKFIDMMKNDPELRPLLFRHETIIRVFKDILGLEAEQMLSIITAAEAQMLNSPKLQRKMTNLEHDLEKKGIKIPIRRVRPPIEPSACLIKPSRPETSSLLKTIGVEIPFDVISDAYQG